MAEILALVQRARAEIRVPSVDDGHLRSWLVGAALWPGSPTPLELSWRV